MKNNRRLVVNSRDQKPEAWVAVSNNRQKNYGSDNDLVYLEDGQEFQIELFNPTQISYLAKIYLNGKLISSSGLVIKPGQRYFLDRHIDEKKKLLFSTYDVDDAPEVRKAIKNNGKIKVEFYPEVFMNNLWSNTSTTYVPYNQQWNGNNLTIPNNPITWATTFGRTNTYFSGDSNPITTTNLNYTSTNTGGITFSTANSISGNSVTFSSNTGEIKCSTAGSFETGRIEKGEKSDQSFGSDYGSYSSIWSYCSEYTIMPRSVKPVEVSEIRSYCTGCGTRMKKKTWKFCPNCGESLE